MKLGVMVLDGPYQHQAADTALQFIRAARARGHEMVGVFLFADGVGNAQKFINPPGERNISQAFEEVARMGATELRLAHGCPREHLQHLEERHFVGADRHAGAV